MKPTYWQRAYHGPALSLDEAKRILGADHVAWTLAQGKSTAACRAAGMWDANMGAEYAAYKALEALAEGA